MNVPVKTDLQRYDILRYGIRIGIKKSPEVARGILRFMTFYDDVMYFGLLNLLGQTDSSTGATLAYAGMNPD